MNMKLAQVTKLDKRNKTTSKKIDYMSFREIRTSLLFFQFMAKLTFSLKSNVFYLTKTESRTRKYLTQFSHYCLE